MLVVGFSATFRTIEMWRDVDDSHAMVNMHTPKCATKVGFLMDQLVMMIWIKLSFGNNISINQTLLNICLWSPFIIVHYVLSVLFYYYSYCYFELLTLLGLKNSCCKEDSFDLSWFVLLVLLFHLPIWKAKSTKRKQMSKPPLEGCKLVMWWVQMIFTASPNLGV